MMTAQYDVAGQLKKLRLEDLIGPIDGAGRALTRVDERLKRSPDLAEGFQARAHFLDTCAAMWLDGELVHLEDLVLHDAGADVRAPTHELTLAARLMRLRRRIEREPADWALTGRGVAALAGRGGNETDADRNKTDQSGQQEADDEAAVEDALLAEIDAVAERARRLADGSATVLDRAVTLEPDLLLRDPDRDEAAVLSEWLKVVGECEALPPVLTAAFILDAWLILDPVERRTELGRLIAAAALRQTVTPNHLPLVAVGLRQSKFRWRGADPVQTRLSILLAGFETGALEAMQQLNRLQFARERMLRRCEACRRNSKLPQLVDLFIAHPFVSIPLARKKLKVTAAAVDRMLEQLGSALPQELTGRGRYRAWGVL